MEKRSGIHAPPSAKLFADVLNSLPHIIAVLDEHGVIAWVNKAWHDFAEANGAPSLAGGWIGANYLTACSHAAQNDCAQAVEAEAGIRDVIEGRQTDFNLEYPCHAFEVKRWFRMRAVPLHGERRGAIISHEDITERYRSLQAKSVSDRYLRIFADRVPAAIAYFDAKQVNRFANQAYLDAHRLAREQVHGKRILDIIGAELFTRNREHILAALAGESRYFENTRIVHLGTEKHVLVNYIPDLVDNEVHGFFVVAVDVTDQFRSRARVHESEARLRAYVDHAADGVFLFDRDWRILDVNRQGYLSLGYTREELIGKQPVDFDADSSTQRMLKHRDELDRNRTVTFESRQRRRDGTLMAVEVRLSQFIVNEEQFALALVRDVTARKRDEQRLLESHARFQKLADAAFEGIALIEDLHIVDCNQCLAAMLGYSIAELVGMDVASLIVSQGPDSVPDNIRRHIEADGEMLVRRRDGAIIELETHGRSVLQDGRTIRIKVVRDVTTHRRSERAFQAIVESTSRATGDNYFQKLVESIAVNLDVRTVVIGKIVHPTLRDTIRTFAVWNGVPTENFEFSCIGTPCAHLFKNEVFSCRECTAEFSSLQSKMPLNGLQSYVGVPVIDALDQAVGVLFVLNDRPIPNVETVETILKVFANRVMAELDRLDAEAQRLQVSRLAVQADKLLSIGGMAAGIAHELNNPLAIMIQNTEVILNRTKTGNPQNELVAARSGTTIEAIHAYMKEREILDMLSSLRKTGNRAANLVKNMLGFSQPRSSQMEAANIHELIDQSLELAWNDVSLKDACDPGRIEIKRCYELASPQVPCHQGELQQVFLNLFKNAAQAMSHGTCDGGRPRLVIRTCLKAGRVHVEIGDNGPGIPEAIRLRVFDPFFTTKPGGQGTGLGLFIAYFIICDSHGGTMTVDSSETGGARFNIDL